MTSQSTNVAVTVDRVTKYYGDVLAVDDVTLEVQEGEFVTLLGPSGCGKSTLLRMVSGFIEPTKGDIRLHGSSVLGVPPHRRNTSMVFQDYALFPHRTVAQNLGFGLRMRKLAKADIARVEAVKQREVADQQKELAEVEKKKASAAAEVAKQNLAKVFVDRAQTSAHVDVHVLANISGTKQALPST